MHITILDIQKMKAHGDRIPMITAYDYTSAQIVDRAGLPLILVGDTLGMVVLGHPTTIPVTVDEMVHHLAAGLRALAAPLRLGPVIRSPDHAGLMGPRRLCSARDRRVGGCHSARSAPSPPFSPPCARTP